MDLSSLLLKDCISSSSQILSKHGSKAMYLHHSHLLHLIFHSFHWIILFWNHLLTHSWSLWPLLFKVTIWSLKCSFSHPLKYVANNFSMAMYHAYLLVLHLFYSIKLVFEFLKIHGSLNYWGASMHPLNLIFQPLKPLLTILFEMDLNPHTTLLISVKSIQIQSWNFVL